MADEQRIYANHGVLWNYPLALFKRLEFEFGWKFRCWGFSGQRWTLMLVRGTPPAAPPATAEGAR